MQFSLGSFSLLRKSVISKCDRIIISCGNGRKITNESCVIADDVKNYVVLLIAIPNFPNVPAPAFFFQLEFLIKTVPFSPPHLSPVVCEKMYILPILVMIYELPKIIYFRMRRKTLSENFVLLFFSFFLNTVDFGTMNFFCCRFFLDERRS